MLALSTTLVALLAYVIVDDYLNFRIRNEVIVIMLLLTALKYMINGLPDQFHLQFGYVVLIFFFLLIMFSRGYLGGGDVKLLPLAFLWLSVEKWLLFYTILTIITIIYATMALLDLVPTDKKNGKPRMAYGPCIALAWILCIL